MKNIDILSASQALTALAQKELPATVGIKIRRLTRQISEASQDIDAERNRLVEKYAKRDDAGAMIYADAAKAQVQMQPEFAAEFNALLDADAEITIDRPLRAKDLGTISIPPALLIALGDLLAEEEEPAP